MVWKRIRTYAVVGAVRADGSEQERIEAQSWRRLAKNDILWTALARQSARLAGRVLEWCLPLGYD